MNLRLFALVLLAFSWSVAHADDPELSPEARQALKFVAGLRARGYHDLAADYLDRLRNSPDAPADLKETLDYQDGRGLLDEASTTTDPDKKTALLDAARTKLDHFARTHANHPLAPDALMQLGRLSIERGHASLLASKESEGGEAKAKLVAARAAFAEARTAYDKAIPLLKARFDSFPKFIPDEQAARREAWKEARESFQNAMLQRPVVDYEEAQTWPPDSKERNEILDKAIVAFEQIYRDYRTALAGLSARMLQAKSYEERGDLGKAMGIYNDLYAQNLRDPQYDEIRRKVGYYRIIVDAKRKEYALVVDEASRWLQENPRLISNESLGVQLELAKGILAQLPDLDEKNREEATRKAADRLNAVVRYYSPFKAEALELLRKYKPKSALSAQQIAAMSYDEALNAADSAMSTQEWDRAIALLKHAIDRADPAENPDKANKARYLLSYCFYASGRYYSSAVLAEHLARRYPTREWSDKAADFGLNSYSMAYNTYNAIDRSSDLLRLIDLAKYIVATWPDSEQSDTARMLLGEIFMGQGKYLEAAEALEATRASSPRKLDSQVRAGDCRWRLAQSLRDQGKTAEAEAQEKAAFELTSKALDARKAAGTPPADASLIANANALAEILLRTGKPKDALAVLEPLDKQITGQPLSADAVPRYEGLLTVMLQAHIADGQSGKAVADMKSLEKTGISREKLTLLYLDLSRILGREMEKQRAQKDSRSFRQAQAAYKQFLSALVASESGQTFDSLSFAGEAMLSLGMAKEAGEIFDRILKTYGKDPALKPDPVKGDPLLRVKLRKVESQRGAKQFDDALKAIDPLIVANPRMLEPMIEKAQIYEDWAKAERKADRWGQAFDQWKKLTNLLDRSRPRRPEYYDSVYHMAVALQNLGRQEDAARTLRSVMVLSPSVGGPEIKAKYQALLAKLK